MYGRVFVVKYVLPKKSKATTAAPNKSPDTSTKYLTQRASIEKAPKEQLGGKEIMSHPIHEKHRHLRAVNEDEKLNVEIDENAKMKRHLRESHKTTGDKRSENKSRTSSGTSFKSGDKKHDTRRSREKQNAGSRMSTAHFDGSNASAKEVLDKISTKKTVHESDFQNSQRRSEVKPSEKSAEEVLNEISPASVASNKPEADMIERFPRPRNTIADAFTRIIFSAEDPLRRYALLINGKRNITLIVSQDCENPVDLKLIITKTPFTSKLPINIRKSCWRFVELFMR